MCEHERGAQRPTEGWTGAQQRPSAPREHRGGVPLTPHAVARPTQFVPHPRVGRELSSDRPPLGNTGAGCHSRPTPWLAPHNSFLTRPPALPASRSLAHFSLTRATCFARSPGLCGSKPVDDFLSTLAVTSACKNDSTGDYDVEFQGTIPCDDAGRAAVIEAVGPATAFTFNFNATGRSSPSFLYGVASGEG